MVKKIIAISDVHIKNIMGSEEFKEQCYKFICECKKILELYKEEEVRIVVCGDLLHSKTQVSNEALTTEAWFLGELDKLCKTIVVCGNHDLNMSNLQRMDSITPVFEMCNFKQTIYIDRELGYASGSLVDDNIVWCLYSTFDGFVGPNDMEVLKSTNKTKKFVGLFHGDLNGAKNASGVALTGLETTHFKGVDFVIAGHIHKQQSIKKKGSPEIVYCGSLIQQNFGEDVENHGFILWDVKTKTWELVKVPNEDRGFYVFSITSEKDIEEGREKYINR